VTGGRAAALARWAAVFETLTPETIQEMRALCAPDVRFRDPFNDVRGIDLMVRVFEDMFETCEAPQFVVVDQALGDRAGYIKWTFTFKPKRLPGAEWRIEGMSEIHFDAQDRIAAHLDHWDASSQFYARLPVLRSLIGLVRRKLSVSV